MDDIEWLAVVALLILVSLFYIALLGDPGAEIGASGGEEAGS